nr:immunoglobulin heavy chain junction region [Mus musculus]
CARGGYDYDW